MIREPTEMLEIEHKYAIACGAVLWFVGIFGGILTGFWPLAFFLMAGGCGGIAFVFWLSP